MSNHSEGAPNTKASVNQQLNQWMGQFAKKPDHNKSKQDKDEKYPNSPFFGYDWTLILALAFLSARFATFVKNFLTTKYIYWETFEEQYLANDQVESIHIIAPRIVKVNLRPQAVSIDSGKTIKMFIISVEDFKKSLRKAEKRLTLEKEIPVSLLVPTQPERLFNGILTITSLVLLVAVGRRYLREIGNDMMKNKFSSFDSIKKDTNNTSKSFKYSDVAGCDEAKLEIMEFVDFLKSSEKYSKLGAKVPKGVLLSGPPGSGKTLLAKATAGEADVSFFQVKGSEFMEMFVGVGAMRLRNLFKKARDSAPSIVFIDEIDAIGRKRSDSASNIGSHREFDNTLNQLLVEMDGFHSKESEKTPVIVMAATNIPNVLDPALTRSGRFDRHIEISLPDKIGREQIFNVHLDDKQAIEKPLIAKQLAEMSPGLSGADIENICNEGAIIAARENSSNININHFEKAIERIIGGMERKSLKLQPNELDIIAYHEAGHALTGHFLKTPDPVLKISIIPRGKGLGYTQYKLSDRYLHSKDYIFDQICVLLGGRVAEMLKYGENFTSGAADDIQKVNQMAYSYVAKLGMSDSIGPIAYATSSPFENRFSDSMMSKIDTEVSSLVQKALGVTRKILETNVGLLDKVAKELRAKEVLKFDEFLSLVKQ